jgi:hypothetical protein
VQRERLGFTVHLRAPRQREDAPVVQRVLALLESFDERRQTHEHLARRSGVPVLQRRERARVVGEGRLHDARVAEAGDRMHERGLERERSLHDARCLCVRREPYPLLVAERAHPHLVGNVARGKEHVEAGKPVRRERQ